MFGIFTIFLIPGGVTQEKNMGFLSDLAKLAVKGTQMAINEGKKMQQDKDKLYEELSGCSTATLKTTVRNTSHSLKRIVAAQILKERGEVLTPEDLHR